MPISRLLILTFACSLFLILAAGCGSDDDPVNPPSSRSVDLSYPVNFSADKSFFLKAEMVEPFSDDPIMRVVLPDESVIYREINSDQVWKEISEDGEQVKSFDIPEEEMLLVKSLNLDTGWQPSGSPLQVRFSMIASEGRLKSKMDGDLTVKCKVGRAETTEAEIGWIGHQDQGELKIEGGLEIVSKFRFNVHINLPWPLDDRDIGWEQEIPNLPNADWGVFKTENFTPFALGQTVTCRDGIDTAHIPVVPIGVPGVASVAAGAAIGGWAQTDLKGLSMDGSCGSGNGSIVSNDGCCPIALNTKGVNELQCQFQNETRFRWVMDIEPEFTLGIDLGVWDGSWGLGITHIPLTIIDENFNLKYSSPVVDVDLATLKMAE